jgi:hypothetical protein
MSSCCPCLEDDMEEMDDLEQDIDEVYEPGEEELSDEQQDKQADIYYSKQNQEKK